MPNIILGSAKREKNDEFYTQLKDIEDELRHYKEQFRGKVVYCNCDDPFESNFFKYFASNFNHLGLKKLITTSYTKSPIAGMQLPLPQIIGLEPSNKAPFKIEINEVPDVNGDGAVGMGDVEWLLKHDANVASPLGGNGDFRSDECVDLLKQADIVVTNPPFSLFREYIAQLAEHNKKFIIIGNKNAITYKEVFKLIKENKLWLGYRNINSDMWLAVPEGEKYEKIVDGVKLKHIMACWFTNLDTTKRHEVFATYKKYTPDEYPAYDNYEAINVDVVADVPGDYSGVMGVPITFLDKYNPAQYEIIDINPHFFAVTEQGLPKPRQLSLHSVGKKDPYARILIKKKEGASV
ncbi:adenine-specific methyltransferase EcoRI family protein [Candidatus Saccharibacteria bacterium]|nr:MAG: adenine-specific methyltransferase EcoRI family protein [Candidatus Saccharibacteria bacterium]